MFNPKAYCELCRELRAPENKIEEVITMTEQNKKKHRRPVQALLVTAAAVALMAVGVSAANPDAFQAFVVNIIETVQVGKYRQEVTVDTGETFTAFECPQVVVENREGRAVLLVGGEAIADITDALAADGYYTCQEVDEGTQLIITVEGTAEDWTASVSVSAPGEDAPVIYTYGSDLEGSGDALDSEADHVYVFGEEDGSEVSTFIIEYDGETFKETPKKD